MKPLSFFVAFSLLLGSFASSAKADSTATNLAAGTNLFANPIIVAINLPILWPFPEPPRYSNWNTTTIKGLSEGLVYGSYIDTNWNTAGFTFDGTNYTTVTNPNSSGFSEITGYSAGVLAGNYQDSSNGNTHGFLFDGTNYTTIDAPNAAGYTQITGYSAGIIAGNYYDTNWVTHGFSYDGTNYREIDDPASVGIGATTVNGIGDGVVYGSYTDTNWNTHGFLFDGAKYTTLDDPKADHGPVSYMRGNTILPGARITEVTAYSGGIAAGNFQEGTTAAGAKAPPGCAVPMFMCLVGLSHGFFYDGTNYTSFDIPGGYNTRIAGYSAGKVVGTFCTNNSSLNFFYDGTNTIEISVPQAETNSLNSPIFLNFSEPVKGAPKPTPKPSPTATPAATPKPTATPKPSATPNTKHPKPTATPKSKPSPTPNSKHLLRPTPTPTPSATPTA